MRTGGRLAGYPVQLPFSLRTLLLSPPRSARVIFSFRILLLLLVAGGHLRGKAREVRLNIIQQAGMEEGRKMRERAWICSTYGVL